MNWIVSALSPVYYGIHKLRNQLYEKQLLEQVRTKAKVLSVGNISFGGTGKTPFVMWLLKQEWLRSKKIAVVSRPYKAKYQGDFHHITEYDYDRSQDYGDEAVMIARNYPQVDVYVGRSKADCAYLADKQEDYDLILLDDGFQHRRLIRDLDIVLLDSSVSEKDYLKVPKGKLRENLEALSRADLCIFTKVEKNSPEGRDALAQKFKLPLIPSVAFGFELGIPTRFTPQNKVEVLDSGEGEYILATGVGNPKQVKESLEKKFGKAKAEAFYEDHYDFTNKDLESLEKLRQEKSARYIFCTEKDYFKMRSVMKNSSNLYYIPIEFQCYQGEDSLVQAIGSLLT